ncbi:MAG: S24/S26 family peptidase [Clostridia bacterium]|nr:S24/S26 family peptidase [Clostridia bacterium]
MDSSHKTALAYDSTTPAKNVTLQEMMPLIRAQLAAGRSVRIYPRGTSMLPMLVEDRDSVVLSPLPDRLRRYDLPLYQRKNGQFVLHRVVRVGETYTCIGDNQFLLEEGLTHEQMIAVVSSFTRDGKEYSVTDLPYRFYRAFWFRSRHIRRFWRRCMGRIRRLLGKK